MADARDAFAATCVSLADVFNPSLIVVGGSLAAGQGERLLGPARAAIERGAFRRPAARVAIVPASLGDDVGLVGARVLFEERTASVDAHAEPERTAW
jgi:predicted NBD/HSP70 family sugar kinase